MPIFPVYRPEIKVAKTSAYWLCLCDCGNIKITEGAKLRNNTIKSCGCLDKEKTRESIFIDLTGRRFNQWTVLEEDKKRKNKDTYWICKCDCGSIRSVNSSNLISGNSQSCGCKKSRGESKISDILRKNNIYFETQKIFPSCFYLNKNHPCRFDFYINNNFLLEYDGIQHYQNSTGWNNKEHLNYTQKHDEYKNQWCRENNIPLKRIPYWELKNVTIENIMDDTFLIT